MTGTNIGELNGRWAVLLKFCLVGVPLIVSIFMASFLPWAVWVTGNIYTSRQTAEIVQQISSDMKAVEDRFDDLPPAEWRDRIRVLENESRQNQKDHAAILIGLEQIKVAVGAAKE